MAYDRINWHSCAENFPEELEYEHGGTHIGFFLAWIIKKDLIGNLHIKTSVDYIKKIKAQSITGKQFLVDMCDEKFTSEDLNDEGNEFTKYYYEDIYLSDLANVFSKYQTLYHIDDSWENFDKISCIIDSHYNKWKSAKNKKWWKIW